MYTLLTGATGLVGRYLVRDLLLNGHHLAVVVRPSRRQSAAQRVEEVLQHWERELGRLLPRPVVLTGDICEAGFGLSADESDWVRQHCNVMIHSAAILEFFGKDRGGEPWRTNFDGTQNMINLCRDLKIHDIHYVSTAYVAGIQDRCVLESDLDVGQSFRNDYEESKFHAETLVRGIDFADHVTVYRPAVIAGDSITGYTNTYHGIYLYLRLLAVMVPPLPPDANGVRCAPIRLHMTGNERRNIIPVEWVSAVMTRLFETQAARGLTFHIAPKEPITSGALISDISRHFNIRGVELVGNMDSAAPAVSREQDEDQWMFERMYKENMTTYAPYERTDNLFDLTNTERFAGDIECPRIDRTVLGRYIDYGNEDRWGKRRPEVADATFSAEDYFLNGISQASPGSSALTMGLDLLGPGGAQLTVTVSPDGLTSAVRGLSDPSVPVIQIPAGEFGEYLRAQQTFDHAAQVTWDPEDSPTAELLGHLLQSLVPQRQNERVESR